MAKGNRSGARGGRSAVRGVHARDGAHASPAARSATMPHGLSRADRKAAQAAARSDAMLDPAVEARYPWLGWAGYALLGLAVVAYLVFTLPQLTRPYMYDDVPFAIAA